MITSVELDDYYYITTINKDSKFNELEVSKSGNYYYLCAHDQESLNIYAFTLDVDQNKILLNKNNEVHSCEVKKNAECNFIKNNDGKIAGCDNCNHAIFLSE